MRRFLLGSLTALLTLAAIVLGSLLLAKAERKPDPIQPTQTIPETETLPAETESLPPVTTIPATLPETLPAEKATIDSVPKYYQTDYPHIDFGNGTIATSGCSVTCLAMVATYLTDREYTPVQMAYHFGSYGKTHVDRLEYGIAQMQLPYQRIHEIQELLTAIQAGKVAIVMMNEQSFFTTEQHFLVVAGINQEGKYLINDPYRTTYLRADVHLKNAYDNGFEEHYLRKGFTGAWVFDKADMPDEPFLYDASLPEERENRYRGYVLTEEDIYTLACFVYVEGREESPEIQQAMAEVVLNRVISQDYPNTVHKVLHETELYRAVPKMKHVQEPEQEQYLAVDAAMYGPYVLPEDICFYSQWTKGTDEWGKLGNYTFYRRS